MVGKTPMIAKVSLKPLLALLCLYLMAPPSPAKANCPDIYAMGTRAAALGGAFTAVADDFSAAYYNPAGITQLPGAELAISSLSAIPLLWTGGLTGETRDAQVNHVNGLNLAVAGPVGRLFGLKDLSMAFTFFMPFQYMVRAYTMQTKAEKYFALYRDLPQRMSFSLVLAYRLARWLSLGAGLQFSFFLYAYTNANYTSGIGGGDNINMEIKRELTLTISPVLGLMVRPLKPLRLGFTYRSRQDVRTDGPYIFSLSGAEVLSSEVHYLSYFSPHQLAWGASYILSEKWLLSLDLTWRKWSDFRNSQMAVPEPTFRNTLTFGFGISYSHRWYLEFLMGYAYAQSPVREQISESNFADGPRHTLSVGLRIDFRRWRLPFRLSFYLRGHFLESRQNVKAAALIPDEDPATPELDTTNPGYPGFRAGGGIFEFGLGLTFFLDKESRDRWYGK